METIITTVPERKVIGNGDFTMSFTVKQENNVDVDLTLNGTLIEFFLYQYNFPDTNVITKTSAIASEIYADATNKNVFTVCISYADTTNLEGLYEYQIQITTPTGAKYRRLTGTISVTKKGS